MKLKMIYLRGKRQLNQSSNIKKNFLYNVGYQILLLILPFITTPYVSRVLGTEGVGIYSYTYSVVNYFMLFAMLGLNNYGNRTIAKVRDDKEKLSKTFSSIYVLQCSTAIIVTLIYILYISVFDNKYFTFALIQIIYMISVFFDVNWFFFGLEKFKLTVTRNVIIKLLSLVSIFLFVKQKDDLSIYILIMALTTLISQLALLPFVRKEVKFVKVKWNDVKKHIKPNLILFIPVIAVSLYKIMDKIMLGNMVEIKYVGLYENAEKVVNIPMGIITALGTVMLPKMSNLIVNNQKDTIKKYIDKSMEFSLFLSVPLCLGIMSVAENFAPIFFGEEFIDAGILIKYLAITIIFITWANVIRTQYLIPNEKDKIYIISVFLGAIVNFIVNIILIPQFKAMGAVIGTIMAEATVMLYQTYRVRKELNIKRYVKLFFKYLYKGIIMYVILLMISLVIKEKVTLIILQVILGCIIYCLLNYKYIMQNIENIPFLNKFRERKGEVK